MDNNNSFVIKNCMNGKELIEENEKKRIINMENIKNDFYERLLFFHEKNNGTDKYPYAFVDFSQYDIEHVRNLITKILDEGQNDIACVTLFNNSYYEIKQLFRKRPYNGNCKLFAIAITKKALDELCNINSYPGQDNSITKTKNYVDNCLKMK